jgi:hypothetical protein
VTIKGIMKERLAMKTFHLRQRRGWREEIYREFSFLYSRGYTLKQASVHGKEAHAVFTSKRRQISVRRDTEDHVYVQIHRSRRPWNLFSRGWSGVNVFEVAKRFHAAKDIPFRLAESDISSIFRLNAEFMQTHLSEVIDGTAWVE